MGGDWETRVFDDVPRDDNSRNLVGVREADTVGMISEASDADETLYLEGVGESAVEVLKSLLRTGLSRICTDAHESCR